MKKLVQLKNKENENLDPINLNYEKRISKNSDDIDLLKGKFDFNIIQKEFSVANISAGIKTNLGYINLQPGLYIGYVWTRNQGGGNTPYNTNIYFDNNNIADEIGKIASIDWSISNIPILINVKENSDYYLRVYHNSSLSHNIDSRLILIKIN